LPVLPELLQHIAEISRLAGGGQGSGSVVCRPWLVVDPVVAWHCLSGNGQRTTDN
jgi:hypothetical protein